MHSHRSTVSNDGHMHGRHSHAEAPRWVMILGICSYSITFVLGLLFWQLSSGSVAILSDALHSLFHVAVYSIAFWGNIHGDRHKQARSTTWIGFIIIATAMYIAASGAMSIKSPQQVLSTYMIAVASIALTVETGQALLKLRVTYQGIKIRKIALIRVLLRDDFIDIIASLGVLTSGIVILKTKFYQADGIAAIPIALFALYLGIITVFESRAELKDAEHHNHDDYAP